MPRAIPPTQSITLVAAVLAVSGCAGSAGRPGDATTRFDGSYSGAFELSEARGQCNRTPVPPLMTVSNGKMSLSYAPRENVYFSQWLRTDGIVATSAVVQGLQIDLKGRFEGDTFTGATDNANCSYTVTMKRKT
jgi:hypothetical protein